VGRPVPGIALIGAFTASILLVGCGASASGGPDEETLRVNLRVYAATVVETIDEAGTSIEMATEDFHNDSRLSDPDIAVRRTAVREALQPMRDALTEAASDLSAIDVAKPMSDAHDELVRIVQDAASRMDGVLTAVRAVDSLDDFEAIGDELVALGSDLEEEGAALCPTMQDVLEDEGVDFDLEC